MNYTVKFQTEPEYKNIRYGGNSIYNSACGPASLCNALKALGIADISIPTMCNLAVSCGARVEGGTDEAVLLRSAASKYGFEWRSTSKNAELLSHLKAGGAAILHAGSTYKLFSNSGHFVAAVAASGQTITVLDSYWYSGKYTASSIRRNYVSVVSKGVVKTSLTQCGKATIDRSPSYYLISKPAPAKKTEPKKEETELVEKTKFEIGGEKFTLDAITKNGTTYVCLKQYNNVLGLDTGYDAATDTRAVNFDQLNIAVNGTEHTVPGLIAGKGHSYASVPDLLKLTGCTVGWNDGSIVVTSSEGDV
ncbi:hypothetical protein [Butyricicoccus porcorum]|uniref:Peptidase C39-like domain-containing protein n=1 Tax=Butyricicoccus porcorum TaxID=1945634 RepID=A0A252F707_9FIRM|nr:hypothetical protein [Butyricicoccus porcorum]OUM21567.1 hypothetical protein CBW42_03110 [Butyricicoccus porcorum]